MSCHPERARRTRRAAVARRTSSGREDLHFFDSTQQSGRTGRSLLVDRAAGWRAAPTGPTLQLSVLNG